MSLFLLFLSQLTVSVSAGFTVMVLWNLFLTPLGLPVINFFMAFGIKILIIVLTTSTEEIMNTLQSPARDNEAIPEYLGIAVGLQIISGCGWLISLAI